MPFFVRINFHNSYSNYTETLYRKITMNIVKNKKTYQAKYLLMNKKLNKVFETETSLPNYLGKEVSVFLFCLGRMTK